MTSRFALAPLDGIHVDASIPALASAFRSQRCLMSAGSERTIGASELLVTRRGSDTASACSCCCGRHAMAQIRRFVVNVAARLLCHEPLFISPGASAPTEFTGTATLAHMD